MKITIPVKIDTPDGTTHYSGELLEDPSFFKMTMVGVVGEHWWRYSLERKEWVLAGHDKPNWVKEL